MSRRVRLALIVCVVTLLGMTAPSLADAATPRPPLHADGARIVDAGGRTAVLQGVNWFGFETSAHVVHGLWARDYRDVLAQVRRMGFNTIRLPFSLQALRSSTITGPDFSRGRNAPLKGATPLHAMDVIVDAAARAGLLVLLENHSLADDGYSYGLWYGQAGFTEDDWVDAWKMLARHFRDRPNVVGADLKNEPHGEATWGTGGPTDWRRAAERAGNAITAIAPDWLIVVEGIEGRVRGGKLDKNWWGGNLEGVRHQPVRLSRPHRVVYSPHEYGPGVFQQPWFARPDMARVLADRWRTGFGYIAVDGIAPLLVGEFGGREVGLDTVEGRWQRQFLDYLGRTGISWTYWALNPDSGDTGGILDDDWTTVNRAKLALLQQAIRRERIAYAAGGSDASDGARPASSARASTSRPQATNRGRSAPAAPVGTAGHPGGPVTPPHPPADATALRADLVVESRWDAGWCGHFAITGPDGADLSNVTVAFTLAPGTRITQSWNGDFSATTGRIHVTLPDWARAPMTSTGFCVAGTGGAGDVHLS